MDKHELQRLRDLDIEDVADRLGLTVTRHRSLCPFHADSHPSLTFHRGRNTYHCFVCGAHGGVIDLAMQLLNSPFTETCRILADANGLSCRPAVARPAAEPKEKRGLDTEYLESLFKNQHFNDAAQRFLLEERRLNPAVVRWLGISSIDHPTPCWRYGRPYFDAPSLLIPYRDVDGRLMNVQSRYLAAADGDTPRFRFAPGGTPTLFNLPLLKLLHPGEDLYLAEGSTDCMALLSAGHKAIGIPSATLLNDRHMQLLRQYAANCRLHIYPDRDDAGERLYGQLVHMANALHCTLVRHDLPPGCKDFGDYWKKEY